MRIFLADADPEIRLALQLLFNQQPGMNVIGIAVRSDGLMEQVMATKPDVLLVNWDLPGHLLLDLLERLCAVAPWLRLIVLGVRFESRPLALAVGADAYIDMNAHPKEIVEVLRSLDKEDAT